MSMFASTKKQKQYMIVFALLAAVLLLTVFVVSADESYFVNDSENVLPRFFDGVYAIGSGGADLLFSDEVYALSSSGLQKLGSAGAEGGGGLLYEDGSIDIRSDIVRIGLFYSYSDARDSGVDSTVLENTSGSGFAFGTLDEDGSFAEFASTVESRLLIQPGEESGINVYKADGTEYLCGVDWTDKNNYLIVRPANPEDEPLTSCAGNRYYGDFAFAVLANSHLTVVNIVDLEHYVMGVCGCEMTESWPIETLKAQAVAARTYAQRYIGTSTYYYVCGFDLTADTYCQAYRGVRGVGDRIRQAVMETQNQYLTSGGRLVDAVYSAADGGATEDGINVFGNDSSYLVGVSDPYEAAAEKENPYSEWTVTMTPAQLGAKVGLDAIRSVTPTTSRTGNIIKLEFVSVSGQTATIIRDRCRTALGLKNIRYEISQDAQGNYVFTGSGCGHNLGMSQWGAYAMAKYYEKDYRFILGYYFTGVGISYGTLE